MEVGGRGGEPSCRFGGLLPSTPKIKCVVVVPTASDRRGERKGVIRGKDPFSELGRREGGGDWSADGVWSSFLLPRGQISWPLKRDFSPPHVFFSVS